MCVFGEVLFDRYADGVRVLGGAPFNVAWHLQAFGLAPRFVSRVGTDPAGEQIRGAMREWGMSTIALQADPQHPTGSVEVTLVDGEPAYRILPDQAYDFISPAADDDAVACELLYHGTLALRNAQSHQALKRLRAARAGQVFVDVNLRDPWWQRSNVEEMLADADWVKLNEHELRLLAAETEGLSAGAMRFCQRYQLHGLVVTRGAEGALAIDSDGHCHEVTPRPGTRVVDTVGAGDAFSAVLLLALYHGWPLPVALPRAQDFAAMIVERRGATIADRGVYQALLKDWHLD